MTTVHEAAAAWREIPLSERAWLREEMLGQAMGHEWATVAANAAIALLEAAAAEPAQRSSKWPHVVTIVLEDNGRVSGDLDDELALWPQCASEGEATSIDGQARSVLSQALQAMLRQDLERLAELRKTAPARLDADRSAQPKTKLLAKHPIDGKCRDWSEATHYEDESGERTALGQPKLSAELIEAVSRSPDDYVVEETAKLRAALKTAEEALLVHAGKWNELDQRFGSKALDEALAAIRAAREGAK